MALCSACQSISVSRLISELQEVPAWWEQLTSKSKPRGMVHHQDARGLTAAAAAGCSLCALILNSLQHQGNKLTSQELKHLHTVLLHSPTYLRPNFDPLKRAFPADDVPGAAYVRGFKIFVPVKDGILTGQLRLYALSGSVAATSGNIIGRPALPSSDSPEAFNLVQNWMQRCLQDHRNCRETFSGAILNESEPPILPARVLYVGPPQGTIAPRLVQTKGLRAHYVAMSHCWGRKKPPLMATKVTMPEYLAGIAWYRIPKAYQDAIVVTHRLGLEYIWIDSLCIAQDDPDEWLVESKMMGAVYENARLTIAASHASDCSQPCFFPREPPPPSVELPYITSTGQYDGSIFATHMPQDYASIAPESSPLDARAWATQEWLLSRRMIFYTAGAVVWSCKTISQRETGGSFHSTARNTRWKAIIEKYSARLLTYPSDRLIALEGLRTEMHKKRVNDTYCFGLWKFDMPDQLLWYCRQPAERHMSPLSLPTWTWASTMHGVRFLQMKKPKNVCDGFKFDELNGILLVQGTLRRITLSKLDSPHFLHWCTTSPTVPKLAGVLEHELDAELQSAISDHNGIVGRATLDERGLLRDAPLCFLQLMTEMVAMGEGDKGKRYHQWGLLLRKVDALEVYERVGAGVVVSATPALDQATTSVYIR